MVTTRAKVETARRAYDTAGKEGAREIVMRVARAMQPITILDLWGGGASAREFRKAVPDAAVISAEKDEDLWPLQLKDADDAGYVAHHGLAEEAPGRYDLIWLDLCSQAGRTAEASIGGVAKKLTPEGVLFLTLLPAREQDRALSGRARLLTLPLWVEEVTRLRVALLWPYRRDNGLPMWLLGLRRLTGDSWFRNEERFREVRDAVTRHGHWRVGIDIAEEQLNGEKRIVRLGDLTPDMQRAVLALIAAAASARTDDFDQAMRADA